MGVGAQAPQRVDPVGEPIPRQAIPVAVRRATSHDRTCYYCGFFGSVFDHVIPVTQGGRSVKGNIVYACHRCNSQKSGKTPAQWREWRIARGLSWPPASPLDTTFAIFEGLTDEQAERLSLALRGDFPPLTTALSELGDLVHADLPVLFDDWRVRMCRIADEYAIHTAI